MPGRGRPFEKGNNAGRGRPPGVKDALPRNFVKRLALEVVDANEQAVRDALKRAATNPKTVLQVLDLAAKLNQEMRPRANTLAGKTVIRIITNVNYMALRAAAVRATPQPLPPTIDSSQ
jgi:hypothetical protein